MIIEDKSELQQYLMDRGLIAQGEAFDMEVLTGGVSSSTVWVETKDKPLVLKQSLAKLKTAADWFSDPNRIKIESDGLNWMYQHLSAGEVPQPLFFDDQHLALGMEGIREPHRNFKEILLNNELPMPLIRKMGSLLGRIHHLGSKDKEAEKLFHDSSYFISLRIEPYYEYAAAKLPELKRFYEALITDTLNVSITVVHGDFSPKNILVKDGALILLDFEVMHYGDPAFDIGFAMTHFLSKANFLGNVAFVEAAGIFWETYRQEFDYAESGFEERCVRHLLGCLIARVHGRSPLEYLTEPQSDWQSSTTMKLIKAKHELLNELLEEYKNELNERNH